jgi:hypothetical protein
LISQEALLSDLRVNDVTVPNFDSYTFNYTIPQYPYGTELPVVTATTMYIDATEVTTNIGEFPGTATVTVTAGNPSITQVYTVSFTIDPGNNTYLMDLLIDDVSWHEFDRDVYSYYIPLPFGTTVYPEVEGIVYDPTSTVDYEYSSSGDTVYVIVTSLNGDTAIYTVVFIIEGAGNAYLKMIYVDWEPLEDFVRYQFDYEVTLPASYTGQPLVSYETEDPKAHAVDSWSSFPPVITITVTAEDGKHTNEYTVTFIKNNSIISYNDETNIRVFPNPCSDKIHFVIDELIETANLEIYSVEGRRVGSYNLHGETNTISIEHLTNGFYFYKIFTDKTLLGTGKFVKN